MFSANAAGRLFLPKIAFIMAVSLIKRYSVAAGTALGIGDLMAFNDLYFLQILFLTVVYAVLVGVVAAFLTDFLQSFKKKKDDEKKNK